MQIKTTKQVKYIIDNQTSMILPPDRVFDVPDNVAIRMIAERNARPYWPGGTQPDDWVEPTLDDIDEPGNDNQDDDVEDLNDLTVAQLKERLDAAEIVYPASGKKDELLQLLVEHLRTEDRDETLV